MRDELLKNGGSAMVDWLTKLLQEVRMADQTDTAGVEGCNAYATAQKERQKDLW